MQSPPLAKPRYYDELRGGGKQEKKDIEGEIERLLKEVEGYRRAKALAARWKEVQPIVDQGSVIYQHWTCRRVFDQVPTVLELLLTLAIIVLAGTFETFDSRKAG